MTGANQAPGDDHARFAPLPVPSSMPADEMPAASWSDTRPASVRAAKAYYQDVYEFFALEGEWEAFNLTERLSPNSDSRKPFEGRPLADGSAHWLVRTIDDRWILLHILFGDEPDGAEQPHREISPSAASFWLRKNGHALPKGLSPVPERFDLTARGKVHVARLASDWRAPAEAACVTEHEGTASTDEHLSDARVPEGPVQEAAIRTRPGREIPARAEPATPEASAGSERAIGTCRAEPGDERGPVIPVVLSGPDEPPIVYGTPKRRLTPARYDTVRACLAAGKLLSGKELDKASKRSDARKHLRALANEDADWNNAIIFPQGPGTKYGIRTSATNPRDSPEDHP